MIDDCLGGYVSPPIPPIFNHEISLKRHYWAFTSSFMQYSVQLNHYFKMQRFTGKHKSNNLTIARLCCIPRRLRLERGRRKEKR